MSINYTFKYIKKGCDNAVVHYSYDGQPISHELNYRHDEIKRYLVGRYMASSEAYWGISEFKVDM